MVELREDPELGFSYAFAGDTLNVATYMRRLLPRAAFGVEYVTALGDDPFSDRMLASWHAERIGTTFVRRLAGELPGLYWITNRPDGDREFFYWRSASAARHLWRSGGLDLGQTLGADDLLYLSAISLAILPPGDRESLLEQVAALRAAGVRVAYDSNYRPRLWSSREEAAAVHHRMLVAVDFFITSFPDESALLGDRTVDETVNRLFACEVPEWVVRAEPGVTITRDHGRRAVEPLAPALVRDTTGAGDAFNAAYLCARLVGHDPAAGIAAGHRIARIVVQNRGAIIPRELTPMLDELLNGTVASGGSPPA
jgi:2-dehydro-3-deoxygluconokinase